MLGLDDIFDACPAQVSTSGPDCNKLGKVTKLGFLCIWLAYPSAHTPYHLGSTSQCRHFDMATNDTLAERLRRRPAKPMGSPRVGSNPTGVVFIIHDP